MINKTNRRRFLTLWAGLLTGFWTAAASLLTGVYVFLPLRGRKKEEEILLGSLSIYGKKFRAVRMRIPINDGWYRRVEQKIVYIHADEKGLPAVLSATCTHLGCTVKWDEAKGEFRCPCHDGRYAPDGSDFPSRLSPLQISEWAPEAIFFANTNWPFWLKTLN